ncbi:MAG: hypothetical protein AAGI14_04230 [Pseudomonadota bacterium]
MRSVSTKDLLRIWLAFFWRATLLGFIAGIGAGFIVGVIFAAIQRPDLIQTVAGFAGFLVGIPVSMWAFVVALRGKYKRFDIVIQYKDEVGETFD